MNMCIKSLQTLIEILEEGPITKVPKGYKQDCQFDYFIKDSDSIDRYFKKKDNPRRFGYMNISYIRFMDAADRYKLHYKGEIVTEYKNGLFNNWPVEQFDKCGNPNDAVYRTDGKYGLTREAAMNSNLMKGV